MPVAEKASFRTTADCKPIDGGDALLVTSSYDGVAIVTLSARETSFRAQVGHAHSADLSPVGLILIAGAEGERGGDVVALYDRAKSYQRIAQQSFSSAHGVVYSARLNAFWALGRSELILVACASTLDVLWRGDLPSLGGHDLSPAGLDELYVTTDTAVYRFDEIRRTFRADRELGLSAGIKSISRSSVGRLAYVQADDPANGVWWTSDIELLRPSGTVRLGDRVYKARWSA